MNSLSDDASPLPEHLHELFWEYDISEIDWTEHQDFISRRILSHGRWEQLLWLREQVGDPQIRRIIKETRGRDLSPRQLRFWQLVPDIPAAQVDGRLLDASRQVWDRRVQ